MLSQRVQVSQVLGGMCQPCIGIADATGHLKLNNLLTSGRLKPARGREPALDLDT